MNTKSLNTDKVISQLEALGLSQTNIAEELKVTRQSVSNWVQGKKFPRPGVLLKLARFLELTFDDIVVKVDSSMEPVVAFRKKGSHKISAEYIEDAKDKGYLLEQLASFLPYDRLSAPPALIEPELEYEYIQAAAKEVRKAIGKTVTEKIDFKDLIDFFNRHYAVIIPVFWGNKTNHENALHIYLPKSRTTWIYLNLDSKVHDFKFWMAHELGHVKVPGLNSEDAEDFADLFAGALLFNQDMAHSEYEHLSNLSCKSDQLARIKETAENLTISPLTIYYEINKYADFIKKSKIDLEKNKAIFKVNTSFCMQYKNIAEHIFDTLPPNAGEYIQSAHEYFDSPFFESLKQLFVQEKKSAGFLQAILNLSPPDAYALYEGLHL
jgi:transcriptional regulator with XRE-family HTH domain